MAQHHGLILVLGVIAASTAQAQQPAAARAAFNHDQEAPRATATRLTGTIRVDGVLRRS